MTEHLDTVADDVLVAEYLPYLTQTLSTWPDRVRVAPHRWVEDLLAGRPQPRQWLARSLPLGEWTWTVERLRALGQRQEIAALSRLDWSWIEVDLTGLRAFFDVATLPNLTSLRFDGLRLGDGLPELLVGTQTLSGLEVLDLTDNDLTEWGVEVLSEHIGPLLRDFELSSNQLTDAGIALLCERADMTGVETLILHDNAIGYDGVTALINTALSSLKHLDLAANAIGLPAALVLARWDGLARLETLDVGGDLLAADVAHALEQAVARGDAEAFPVAFDE